MDLLMVIEGIACVQLRSAKVASAAEKVTDRQPGVRDPAVLASTSAAYGRLQLVMTAEHLIR